MNAGKAIALLGATLAIIGVGSVVRADVDFDVSDVPTMFFIDKSDDRNRVDYGIRLDETCRPTNDSPVLVYWREFEQGRNGRVTHGLNIFEGPVYGVGSQRVTERRDDGASLTIDIRALSSRRIDIVTGHDTTPGRCTARAIANVGGVRAYLERVHLTLGDSPGSLRYGDIYGSAVDGGRAVTERVAH